MLSLLHQMMAMAFERETVPTPWKAAIQTPIYKGKGEKVDCGNYRLITLLSAAAKMYEIILKKRVRRTLKLTQLLDINQGGFQADRGTLFCLYIMTELLRGRKRAMSVGAAPHPAGKGPTYCLFIDFKKAFPSVYKEGLWVLLHEAGVKGKLWRVLHNLLTQTSSRVTFEGIHSAIYEAINGVREGSVLSPTLFIIFVNGLLKALRSLGLGAKWSLIWLGALMYADDLVLIATLWSDLQRMFNLVITYCRKWRLSLNRLKTQVVVFGESKAARDLRRTLDHEGIWLQDQRLSEADAYEYLGVWLSHDLRSTTHENKRALAVTATCRTLQRMGVQATKLEPGMGRVVLEALLGGRIKYGLAFTGHPVRGPGAALVRAQRLALHRYTGAYSLSDGKSKLEAECGIDYVITRMVRERWTLLGLIRANKHWHPTLQAIHDYNMLHLETPTPSRGHLATQESAAQFWCDFLGMQEHWSTLAASVSQSHNRTAHMKAGKALGLACNNRRYNARMPLVEGGHRQLRGDEAVWELAPYLRHKTVPYPVDALTAFRLGASVLQRSPKGEPLLKGDGTPIVDTCPHCTLSWRAGPNQHVMMDCIIFHKLRTKKMGELAPWIIDLLDHLDPDREGRGSLPSGTALLMILLGKPPSPLDPPTDPPHRGRRRGAATDPQGRDNSKAVALHQRVVRAASRLIDSMCKLALRRYRGSA